MTVSDVMLVDLGSIFWPAWYSTENAPVSEAHDRSIERIRQLTPGYKLVAVCCDSGSNFRKDIDPSYKANRPPRNDRSYAELDRTKATLRAQGLLLWEVEGLEADDVLATACRAAVKRDHYVVIASADKDLAQLVEHGVTWLSPKTGEHLDRNGIFAKFGVYPEQMRDYLALMGDKSDNIRGVSGIGPKGAAKLLADYRTIEQLMSAVVNTPSKVATPKVCASLRDALVWLPTTIRLVSLRYDAPIDWNEIYQERVPGAQKEPLEMDDDKSESEAPESEAPEVESEAVELRNEPANEVQPASIEPTQPAPSVQLARVEQSAIVAPSWELGLEPTSLGAAYKLAKGLYESKLYTRFPTAEAIWAVIIRGRELGLGALTALDCFHIVEGKPTPSAHFLISRARRHPDCEYIEFIQGDATFALWEGKTRHGKPIPLRYTIEQASAADLLKPTRSGAPSNWIKRPDEMLRKTAGVQLSRIIAPGALMGLYSAEELGAA